MQISMLCEYMERPIGLDMAHPRFFWNVDDNGVVIKGYQIQVSEQEYGDALVWDSGVNRQEGAMKAQYAGAPLVSGATYYWKLNLWVQKDDREMVCESKTAVFTMGLIGEDTWKAGWIGGIRIDQSCYLYRSEFICEKEIKRAAAFVASPCYNVVTVNGQNADDSVLNNVFADYEKSLYYATYDITDLLAESNAIGVMTGRGWHSLRESEDGIGWGDSLFSMQIRLEYVDGQVEWIYSDRSRWTYHTDGPVVYNSIYNGEVYDATKELTGWDQYGYQSAEFVPVVEREAPNGVLRSQMLEPIRVVEDIEAVEIIPLSDGSYIIDYGKNFAGWVKMQISGQRGQKVSIKPAELINEDGSVNPVSLRNAHPVDTYICKGEGIEVYEPRFTYHGFRYIQIYGLSEAPTKEMFIGRAVRSDVTPIGSFESSDDIVNRFYQMVFQTESSNLHGVPTDCPQRDERLGWLNDMTVRNEGALYNYRLYQLYAKWLRDIRDTQGATTGAITDTAPFMRYGFRPADPVSASFLLLPWNLYLHYGDDSIIRENYEANARWVDYLKRNSNDLIVQFSSMGDWAAPIGGTDHTSTGGGALSTITPQLLMSTGFFYYDCTLMAKMAKVLDKTEDEAYYLKLADQVKEAFTREYFHEDGYYAMNSQAANILPLYFDMVAEDQVEKVLDHLCQDIMEHHGGHLTTGNICTRYAIEVLFRYGRQDVAWHLLSQTEYPSWGYMLENGATTLWERWEKIEDNDFLAAMATMNHPMNGGAAVSLHKYLAGITPDAEAPGFELIHIRPIIPERAQFVKAQIQTIRGSVVSGWEKQDGQLILSVRIPSGSKASILLPAKDGQSGQEVTVGAGDHTFHIPWKD